MTLAQLLRALGRRWYVLLVGVIVTAAAAGAVFQADGVYTARTSITLTAPAGWIVAGNTFTDSAASLVGFAKLVEESLPEAQTGQLFAGADTPLYGSGILDGAVVYLPNYGGQWSPNFNRPTLIIDVVAPTAPEVEERVLTLTGEIVATMDQLQDEQGVVEDQRVGWYASPATPEISYVGTNRTRALGGIAVLGAGLTVAAALVLDVVLRRRRQSRN